MKQVVCAGLCLLFCLMAGPGPAQTHSNRLGERRRFLQEYTALCREYADMLPRYRIAQMLGVSLEKFVNSLYALESRLADLQTRYTNFHRPHPQQADLEQAARKAEQVVLSLVRRLARTHLEDVDFLEHYLEFRRFVDKRQGHLIRLYWYRLTNKEMQQAKNLYRQVVILLKSLNRQLQEAKTGGEAAGIVIVFRQQMDLLAKQGQRLEKKQYDLQNHPLLVPYRRAFEVEAKRFFRIVTEKAKKFQSDPEFIKALRGF